MGVFKKKEKVTLDEFDISEGATPKEAQRAKFKKEKKEKKKRGVRGDMEQSSTFVNRFGIITGVVWLCYLILGIYITNEFFIVIVRGIAFLMLFIYIVCTILHTWFHRKDIW